MQVVEEIQNLTVAFSPFLKRYTLEEFWELPAPEDRSHYELIEGVLFTVPPPNKPHGKIIANLTRSLIGFVINTENSGNVYHPRESIYVEEIWGTYLEPDMMFISAELEEKMGERRSSADIVFECLSESTGVYDRTTKADTYLGLGVKELWLVDADRQEIEVRNASVYADRLVWKRRIYQKGETAESQILENWKVPVSEVFAE